MSMKTKMYSHSQTNAQQKWLSMAVFWILINVMCIVNIRCHEANFCEAEARCHEAEIEAKARKSEADAEAEAEWFGLEAT